MHSDAIRRGNSSACSCLTGSKKAVLMHWNGLDLRTMHGRMLVVVRIKDLDPARATLIYGRNMHWLGIVIYHVNALTHM